MTPRDLLINALMMIECYRRVPDEIDHMTFLADVHGVIQAAWRQMDGHIKETPPEVVGLIASIHAGIALANAMSPEFPPGT